MHNRPIASLIKSRYVVIRPALSQTQRMLSAVFDNNGKDVCISSQ